MNKRLLIALAILIALPLHADFHSIERALRTKLGSPRWIPGLGLVRLASNVVHPNGVHDFQLAVFEHGKIDGREAMALMDHEASGFTPLVRARLQHGEWSYVYARPGKDGRMELMVLTSDNKQTVLVRCDLDAERFGRWVGKPEKFAKLDR